VPKENLVGELNRGWGIAKYLLTHERQMIGAGGTAKGPLSKKTLGEIALESIGVDDRERLRDPFLRARIADSDIESLCVDLTVARLKDEASQGIEVGARSAILKYAGTEAKKRRHEILMACSGFDALTSVDIGPETGVFAREWLRSKATSIEGGTSEIMLNIISKNILQLPGE
jgi:acyl-CoA dehydrogenase